MTDQPSRTIAAGALIAAPILLLASTVLFATVGTGMNEGEAAGAVLVCRC
jgi:hypothetical protein